MLLSKLGIINAGFLFIRRNLSIPNFDIIPPPLMKPIFGFDVSVHGIQSMQDG